MTEEKKPHHHGALREALIAAGIRLLEQGGPDALTLRRCAALAGVSHAAPAHHFDGLAGLKLAIADEGFRRFRDCMLTAEAQGDPSPRGRLKGICRGYLAFARANRAMFHLLFGYEMSAPHHGGVPDAARVGYDVLSRCCAPFVSPGSDPRAIEIQVWSLIHGYASLSLAGRIGPDDPALFEQVLALLDRVGNAS
ncbi:MAG: TetR/AcrR family transcriptional regulator [Pseudooceanicola sp.]|nr:TetR/AcrR family transcriptional regulator [Pseudooceanicola sp.]